MLSALDPLGLPVATQVVSGESLNEHGLLYVGDCKMAALETRAFLQANQDGYLCPLSNKQLPEAVLDEYLQPVWAGTQPLTAVTREREANQPEVIAEGYERTVTLSAEVRGQTLARTATEALHARLAKAQAEVGHLTEHKQGKKRSEDVASLQQAAQTILKQHRVEGLLSVTIEEYLVERGFGRVIGKALSLSPMYLHSHQRATGLIRLLSIGLRILTLLEWSCRQRLADSKATVAGLYAGNPKRTTTRPTAEALLGAFKHIHLSVVTIDQQLHRHLTPLSEVQHHLLALLDFSPAIYDQLWAEFPRPT